MPTDGGGGGGGGLKTEGRARRTVIKSEREDESSRFASRKAITGQNTV